MKKQADEGSKAQAKLLELEAAEQLKTRLSALETDGLKFADESGKSQSERVKTMTDEQFVSYKSDLLLVKTEASKGAKALTSQAQEKESAEKAKLLASATIEVTADNKNPYLKL